MANHAQEASRSSYRVLALDGGGMRGVFTAAVLAEMETMFGSSFLDGFDLIVGTSTGGILALGLASGNTCAQMLDFYRTAGPEIFARPRRLLQVIMPKYSRKSLDAVLQREFGDLIMNDLSRAVCITAHELVTGTPRVWKDDHAEGLTTGGPLRVRDVAAATSAAPTYFAPVRLMTADSHIDGGVWGNNPAMVGVTEAVRYGKRPLAEIHMLSIGTTSSTLRIPSLGRARRMGKIAWGFKALHLLQGSSAMAADRQAALLLGPKNYLRIDVEDAQRIKLDDVKRCLQLEETGRNEARTKRSALHAFLTP